MTLVKFQNRKSFPTFADRFFAEDPFSLANQLLRAERNWLPAVNIQETDTAYEVALVAPGRKREDFKIALHEQVLTISSELSNQKEEKDETAKVTHKEFSLERFERSFNVPDHVDEDKIKATYEAGVLHIRIPKREEMKSKQARLIDIL